MPNSGTRSARYTEKRTVYKDPLFRRMVDDLFSNARLSHIRYPGIEASTEMIDKYSKSVGAYVSPDDSKYAAAYLLVYNKVGMKPVEARRMKPAVRFLKDRNEAEYNLYGGIRKEITDRIMDDCK